MTAPTIADVQRAVAQAYQVPLSRLLGECRDAEIVLPRRVAMYLARELTGRSLPTLGRAFRRDHTTVLEGVRKIAERARVDADLGNRIVELRYRLAG